MSSVAAKELLVSLPPGSHSTNHERAPATCPVLL